MKKKITIKRTDSNNLDFQKLVKALDESLKVYYKEEVSFYNTLNVIDEIKQAVVAYDELGNLVGCGAFKKYSNEEAEIKRMFVPLIYRGKGIATLMLNELENWSKEFNFKKCILETLKEKHYAISFYRKNHYKETPNFGEYKSAKNSLCFAKQL